MKVKLIVSDAIGEKIEENENLSELKDKLEDILVGLNLYMKDKDLQSQAYIIHKEYIELMQIPTLKGIIELAQRQFDENSRYISTLTEYFSDGEIDQEYWESALSELLSQYNSLVQNYKDEMEEYYSELSLYEQMNASDSNSFMMQIMQQQISAMYSLIQLYQDRLKKLDDMNCSLFGLYYDVEYLRPFVVQAVNQLNNMLVGEGGYYAIYSVDHSVFSNLANAMIGMEIADMIREELGDEYMQAFYAGTLTEAQQESMMLDAVNIATGFAPSYTAEVGHMEIPIWPGFSVYFENTITVDPGEDIPVSYDISINEDAEYLASNSISIGDFEMVFDGIETGLQYEEDINEFSTVYAEITVEATEATFSLEYGVSTSIEEITSDGISTSVETTIAVGANISPVGGTWQTDEVAVEAYSTVYAPEWDLALETYEDAEVIEVPIAAGVTYSEVNGIEVADYNGHMVTDAITLMTFIFCTGSPAGLFLLFGF